MSKDALSDALCSCQLPAVCMFMAGKSLSWHIFQWGALGDTS